MNPAALDRIHLFELEDFHWMPAFIRDTLTVVLKAGHEWIGSDRAWASYVQKLLHFSDTKQLVDFCSGSGGPAVAIHQRLRKDFPSLKLILTDLFPNTQAIKKYPAGSPIEYQAQAVDAAHPNPNLQGVRTMFSSFHHMPPKVAQGILKAAWQAKAPIGLFEITTQHPLAYFTYAFLVPLLSLPLLCSTSPSFWQVFFSTVLPVVPWVIAWDGFASCLRTYTVQDLKKLTAELQSSDYVWEIFEIQIPWMPFKVPILLGYPVSK